MWDPLQRSIGNIKTMKKVHINMCPIFDFVSELQPNDSTELFVQYSISRDLLIRYVLGYSSLFS